jgi:hypothetical protein
VANKGEVFKPPYVAVLRVWRPNRTKGMGTSAYASSLCLPWKAFFLMVDRCTPALLLGRQEPMSGS